MFFSTLAIWMRNQFMLHRSRNSGRDLLVEPAPLWASSYTHLLYKAQDPFSMQTVQLYLNNVFLYAGNLDEKPVYASQIKKLRKRFFGGTSSLVGQFLHPSPVQSSRSIQCILTVLLPKQFFFSL